VLPEYRQGDSVWPGRPVADVIESGRMEVRAKVDETDRANLSGGQPAAIYVDTLPGSTFKGRVGALSELASRANWFESSSVNRNFDITFQFDEPDPRLKAGSSARVVIEGKEVADALHLPRQAVFDKNGKNHVFVKVGDRFEQREVKVLQRTESRVAVSGLADGTEVALVDPSSSARASSSPSSASPLPAAGAPR
jgi:HlyD family secretion protein